MKKQFIIFALLFTMLFGTNAVYAQTQNNYNIAIIDSNLSTNDLESQFATFVDSNDIGNYVAYAVSYDDIYNNQPLQNELTKKFNDGAQITIYGALTIENYKNMLDIENMSFSTKVYDTNDEYQNTLTSQFIEEYERTAEQNIISYSKNSKLPNLLADVEYYNNEITITQIIINEFEANRNVFFERLLILDSQFGFKSYVGAEGTVNVEMSYILYKNDNDADPNKDYYALTTNFTFSIGNGSFLSVKHEAADKSYNFLDYGPRNTSGTSSISVNLGTGGISLSYNYTANGKPRITTSNDTTNKAILWQMRHVPFTSMFGTSMYSFSSSFAVPQNTSTLKMDITFRGEFSRPSVTTRTKEKTVAIRFDV